MWEANLTTECLSYREITKPLRPLGKAASLLLEILGLLCKSMVSEPFRGGLFRTSLPTMWFWLLVVTLKPHGPFSGCMVLGWYLGGKMVRLALLLRPVPIVGSGQGWRRMRNLRPSGEGNGHPFQYSCLENPMDRGVWWAIVQGVEKESDTTPSPLPSQKPQGLCKA